MSKKEMNSEDITTDETVDNNEAEVVDNDKASDNIADDADKKTANDKKKKKKDPKDDIIEELQDKFKRQIAEFDNFRKRTDKEKSAMYEIGAKDVIEKVLPVVDNFDRAFNAITEEEQATPFAEGMDKVYKQLMKVMEDLGVKPIEAVGSEFNPDLHNAVMHVDDDSVGESIVVEEFEKGYTYRESVVRHSMVKVAN